MISGRKLSGPMGASVRAALVIAVAWVAALPAAAFFTFGGFLSETNETVFVRWPFYLMDVDRNGDISGPLDGIPITIEGGEFGFTSDEIDVLIAAFNVWENLPGSYVAFSFTEPVSEPLLSIPVNGEVGFDGFNYVSVTSPDDVVTPGIDGALGVAFLLYSIEPLQVIDPISNQTVTFAPGEMIESDIIFDASFFRTELNPNVDLTDFFATAVHEIGHLIGLGHTPIHNLRETEDADNADEFAFIEEPVLTERSTSGALVTVGVTPTMWPIQFATRNESGVVIDGGGTLAPDDVSAAYFLYPRQEQLDDRFSFSSEARTHTRAGVPSFPLLGGLVTAWADHDNNSTTGRVPLIGSMTGLYVNGVPQFEGRFTMYGLPKRLLDSNGVLFDVNYVMTLQPLNGFDLAGFGPIAYDSMHNQNDTGFDARAESEYVTAFPSEVFREEGNVFDVTNRNLGTPLYYDTVRRVVASLNTGKSLDQILPTQFPMFGDPNGVGTCPVAATAAAMPGNGLLSKLGVDTATTSTALLAALRTARDSSVGQSPLGVALTDAYYRVAPPAAAFLQSHSWAMSLATTLWMCAMFVYALGLPFWIAAITLSAVVTAAVRRRVKLRAAVAAAALVLAIALAGPAAEARSLPPVSTTKMVADSHEVIHAVVTETKSYWWGENRLIVTDVTLDVQTTAKGNFAKADTLTITVAGGEIDGFHLEAVGLPKFEKGEEVVLFLKHRESNGTVVTSGERGKYLVETDASTGTKYINPGSSAGAIGLRDVQKSIAEKNADGEPDTKSRVSLDDFMSFVRDTDQKQAKAADEDGQ